MVFNRPIWAPNVILVDLPQGDLKMHLPKILQHIGLPDKLVGVNALSDELEINNRRIIIHQEDYEIYRELSSEQINPSTILLENKAKIVYYIDVDSESSKAAFAHIYDLIGDEYPIVCLSKYLPFSVQSGITIGNNITKYPKEKLKSTQLMTVDMFLKSSIEYNGETFIAE